MATTLLAMLAMPILYASTAPATGAINLKRQLNKENAVMSKRHDEYDEDQVDTRYIRNREKRNRNEYKFKNIDPRQLLEDEFYDDDDMYAGFERFHGKK
jgi:hypothetical protein